MDHRAEWKYERCRTEKGEYDKEVTIDSQQSETMRQNSTQVEINSKMDNENTDSKNFKCIRVYSTDKLVNTDQKERKQNTRTNVLPD